MCPVNSIYKEKNYTSTFFFYVLVFFYIYAILLEKECEKPNECLAVIMRVVLEAM